MDMTRFPLSASISLIKQVYLQINGHTVQQRGNIPVADPSVLDTVRIIWLAITTSFVNTTQTRRISVSLTKYSSCSNSKIATKRCNKNVTESPSLSSIIFRETDSMIKQQRARHTDKQKNRQTNKGKQ